LTAADESIGDAAISKFPIDQCEAAWLCSFQSFDNAPGFRDITVNCLIRGHGRTVFVELMLPAIDALRLARFVFQVNVASWSDGNRPIDALPGEQFDGPAENAWLEGSP